MLLCLVLLFSLMPLSALAATSAADFQDVKEGDWYYSYVDYAVKNGLMNGVSDTAFNPNGSVTRAMIVTILYRLEGQPTVTGTSSFKDVPAGTWYSDPVTWASANGVVNGYSVDVFGPNDNVTREQFATILYRYSNAKGFDVTGKADLSKYQDASAVSSWASDAMAWANGVGLINGMTETILSPKGNATRAQAATILMRYCDSVADGVGSFFLSASDSAVLVGYGDNVNIYLQTNMKVDYIDLYDTATGKVAATMYDDGSFYNHGDDIAGDGIYSAIVENENYYEDSSRSFKAKCDGHESNEVTVNYYMPLSDEMLNRIETVDNQIDSLVAGSFDGMSTAEKKNAANALLDELAGNDLIEADSVVLDEASQVLGFEYADGIWGGIMLEEFDVDFNGVGDRGTSAAVYEKFGADSSMPMNGGNAAVSVLVLNAFPAFETKASDIAYRSDFYVDMKAEWDSMGLITTLDTDVSVNDYLTKLDDYDIVCISTHGSTYSWRDGFLWLDKHQYPAICLAEKSTKAKDKEYELLLKDKQIVKVSGKYWILPPFFENQYAADAFDGEFFYSESCQFMGKNGVVDYSMANAIVSRSAEAVVGFHNSVYADYSRDMMKWYIEDLFNGNTAKVSLDDACKKYGSDHKVWLESLGYTYDKTKPVAYPILSGDPNATLIQSNLLNGDFEAYKNIGYTATPSDWNAEGDVRSVTLLGDVKPYGINSSRMAIITTGVGSKTTSTLGEGTEGSQIYQKFTVPAGVTKITFNYNYVSEEPMEFVGSQYNDAFVVQIKSGSDVVYNNMYESINTSTWVSVDNIDFDGGDETVFQTGWKTATIDVSAYQGKTIGLYFIVYDVGDSQYDSAVVLDNVKLS